MRKKLKKKAAKENRIKAREERRLRKIQNKV